jgi:threonylcarbamoyladenosine tRNA methylthiotransferase MtaB
MSVVTETLGCRLNSFESEIIRAEAAKAGLDNAVIVNTCAVTAEAVRQGRQAVRRARRQNPGAKIIVTGCAAQTEPGTFAAMDEVDLVLGNEEKLTAASYAGLAVDDCERVRVNDIFSVTQTAGHLIEGIEGRARAFVQVQNGCDHRCTFCIIPFGRGNSRSVPMGEVVDQVMRLVDNGYAEIVLTGVDITAYGADLPGRLRLGTLVQQILIRVPALRRLRISSIDSVEADGALLEAIASEERLMPHLHLSLQSGDDMILKRMKRRHSRADTLRFVERVRAARPDVAFGADIIAGFPTETEAMFANTIAIVEEAGLTFLHVFPFSARPGTPAARMPQVDRRQVKERAARLRQAGAQRQVQFCRTLVGRRASVLVEREGVGKSEHFVPVTLDGGRPCEIVQVEVTGVAADGVTARTLRDAA